MARTSSPPSKRGTTRRRRIALGVAVLGIAATLGLWTAVHRVPWLGASIADGLRSAFGPRFVAGLEDVAYSAQDRYDQWRFRGKKPKILWETPPAVVEPASPAASAAPSAPPPFSPSPFAAPDPAVAAPGDGVWIAIADDGEPLEPPRMWKALVHSDPRRPYAALAVVVMVRDAFDLHLMAGTTEPESPWVARGARKGLVPEPHHALLVAAFNGGFKATHGQYGMLLEGVEFLPPRDYACTFVHGKDGSLTIGTWSELKADKAAMLYYRQTPPCLVEKGEVHAALRYNEYAKGWGATVSGETVIRRSAMGLSEDGGLIYFGIGDALTAQSLARGVKAAGAHAVAELDVNYSYPRFLFYAKAETDKPPLVTSAIIAGIEFSKDQYVTRPSPRDFFYLTRRKGKKAALEPELGPAGSRLTSL
ncbi:MAG: hypothetical protein EXR75_15755 [Myxococcales bacterium]|nr:hypothetical protein [Myxococcales bacterium]